MSIATIGREFSTVSEIKLKPCPNCGEQIDLHAGHINNGRVFVCEKGKPLMREVKYYCGNCNSTVIFLKKCEPEVTGR